MSLHKPTVFTGAATALITPFRDGKIDRAALAGLIEFQIAGGIAAILVAGTTGESATLDFDEHGELIAAASEIIAGRVPLLAGCGSNCTERAARLAKIACDVGADALLAVTPYYNKASARGVLLHYRAIAEASARPVLVYNVPARTGMTLTVQTYRELAKLDRICGVKEASGDLELLGQLVTDCGEDLDIYTGNDTQTVSAMRLGARGVISVVSNLLPDRMSALCRLCADGDYRRASQILQELRPLLRVLSAEVNPIPRQVRGGAPRALPPRIPPPPHPAFPGGPPGAGGGKTLGLCPKPRLNLS